MRKVFMGRIAMAIILMLDVALYPMSVAHAGPNDEPPAGAQSPMAEEFKENTQLFTKLADDIDAGKPVPPTDPLHAVGQRVELLKNGKVINQYSLSEVAIDRPKIAFTSIRAYIDKQNDELVIEASNGENEKGELGEVVARHFIPMTTKDHKIEPVALVQDDELLTIVGADGRLHAMNWHWVVENAFRYFAPVLTDLYVPTHKVDFRGTQVTAEYITAGSKPFSEHDVTPTTILARDEKGNVQWDGGDVLIRTANGQVYGIFSRNVIHLLVAKWSRIIRLVGAYLSRDPRNTEMVAEEMASEDAKTEDFERQLDLLQSSAQGDDMIKMAMRALGPEQLAFLKTNANDHSRFATRVRDRSFSLEEWYDTYMTIRQKNMKPGEEDTGEDLKEENLSRRWQQGLSETYDNTAKPESRFSRMMGAVRNIQKKTKIPAEAYVAGAITAYMATPWLYQHSEAMQQVAFLNYLYTNATPPVLKEQWYVMPALMMSTITLSLIMPLTYYTSLVTGWAIRTAGQARQNSAGKFSRWVRDKAKIWGVLDDWQRIMTFSCRIYPEMVFSLPASLTERVAKQKTFVLALSNGINPFSKREYVDDDGQTKKSYVGLIKPSLESYTPGATDERYNQDLNRKLILLGDAKLEKERGRNHAWLLAAVAVAEKYDVDLATLLTMEQLNKDPKLEDVEFLYANPQARQEWNVLTDRLQGQLATMPYQIINNDAPFTPPEAIQAEYEKASKLAEKLVKADPARKFLSQLRYDAKLKAIDLAVWMLNYGRKEFIQLKDLIPNMKVTGIVKNAAVPDMLIGVFMSAMVGDRANLAKPDFLAANAAGSWIYGYNRLNHVMDMGTQAQLYILTYGGRVALQHQAIKPREETTYAPREYKTINSAESEQTLGEALKAAGKQLVKNPLEIDFGGVVNGFWTRYLRTAQSTVLLQFAMRATLGYSTVGSLGHALEGTILFLVSSTVWFFWPALLSQAVEMHNHKVLTDGNAALLEARRKLSWAQRESSTEVGQNNFVEGVAALRLLYAENRPRLLRDFEAAVTAEAPTLHARVANILKYTQATPPIANADKGSWILEKLILGAGMTAGLTTYLGISQSVWLLQPDTLEFHNFVIETAEWLSFTIGASELGRVLSKDAYQNNKFGWGFVKKFGMSKVESEKAAAAKSGCGAIIEGTLAKAAGAN